MSETAKPDSTENGTERRGQALHSPLDPVPSDERNGNPATPARQAKMPLVQRSYPHAEGTVDVHPRMLVIDPFPTTWGLRPPPPNRRGNVETFSAKSRYRMIRTLNKVRLTELSRAWWISLTYHERFPAGKPQLLNDLEALRQRIRRRFPRFVYVLRLDWQQRGWPHWHMIAWAELGNSSWENAATGRWIARIWHEIAEPESEHHAEYGAKVKQVGSWRQLASYVSAYAAKPDERDPIPYTGRRWSTAYALPTGPKSRIDADGLSLRRLRRACLLLARIRGAGQRWLYGCSRQKVELSLFIRPGEADRLLRLAHLDQGERHAYPHEAPE